MTSFENSLEHHGIRGMKWGVRRSESEIASASSASEDHTRARATLATIKKSGGTHTVSNKDLEHLTNRLQLEQRFAKASEASMTTRQKGAAFAKKALAEIAKDTAKSLTREAVRNAVDHNVLASKGKHAKGGHGGHHK